MRFKTINLNILIRISLFRFAQHTHRRRFLFKYRNSGHSGLCNIAIVYLATAIAQWHLNNNRMQCGMWNTRNLSRTIHAAWPHHPIATLRHGDCVFTYLLLFERCVRMRMAPCDVCVCVLYGRARPSTARD